MATSPRNSCLRNKNYDREKRDERSKFRNESSFNRWNDSDCLRSPLRTRGLSPSLKTRKDHAQSRRCLHKRWGSSRDQTSPVPTWTLSLEDFPSLKVPETAETRDVSAKDKVPVKKDWYTMVLEEEVENVIQLVDTCKADKLFASEVSPKCRQRNWAEVVSCSRPLQEKNGPHLMSRCLESSRNPSESTSEDQENSPKMKPKVEYETNEEVLSRRQKQVDYGKNTIGYDLYTRAVPRSMRKREDPRTPLKHMKYSRRSWDSQIKLWRLQLHKWDLPSATADDLCQSIDIGLSDLILDATSKAGFPVKKRTKQSSVGSSSDTRCDSAASFGSDTQEITFNDDEEEELIKFL